MTSMVDVHIIGLQLEPVSGHSVVLLGESSTPTRVLPIIIGPAEARSIAWAVAGYEPPRPGTHDLMVDVIERVGSRLESVSVTELSGGTFFAELLIEAPSGRHRISARPSDGIALAVRTGAPISVHSDVLDAAAVAVIDGTAAPFTEEEIDDIVDRFQGFLETAEPSDFDLPEGDED